MGLERNSPAGRYLTVRYHSWCDSRNNVSVGDTRNYGDWLMGSPVCQRLERNKTAKLFTRSCREEPPKVITIYEDTQFQVNAPNFSSMSDELLSLK